jgi:hypothetical protein
MGSFSGIVQEQSVGRRSYTFPSGFRGIIQEIPTTVRFIKVTDYKGVPLSNVQVKVNNSGGALTTITNQDGQAEILPDVGTAITIDLKQYSMELIGQPYNTTTSPIVTAIILDTIIPHL